MTTDFGRPPQWFGAIGSRLETHKFWVLLCLITLYGFFLRVYQFDKQSLWMDEGISVVHAQAILKHGTPILENGRTSWDSFPVHYLMASGLSLSPDPQSGSRIWSIILGTACIPLFGLLNRRIFDSPWQALIAAALMTVITCEIAWSRQARLYIFLQFFSISSLLLLYRYLETRGLISGLLAATLALLAVFTHRAGYLVLLVAGAILLLAKHPNGRCPIKARLAFFAIATLVIAGTLLVPSHSNFGDALRKLISFGGQNYAMPYLQYLSGQLGILMAFCAIGALVASYKSWRKCLPLLLGVTAYFLIFAFTWRYFAHRYVFPIVFILLIFSAYAIEIPLVGHKSLPQTGKILRRVFCLILFVMAIMLSDSTIIPSEKFIFGYTEPQPEWKRGYAMISERERLLTGSAAPTTISTFPYFHDIYLGPKKGTKYYLPITYTGFPGDSEKTSNYTSATPITSLTALKEISGYLILDDFSFRMLDNPEIKHYLQNKTPNAVIKDTFKLFIWIMPGRPVIAP